MALSGQFSHLTKRPLMTHSGHAACPPLVLSGSFAFCSVVAA
jgi:hypothetical protein